MNYPTQWPQFFTATIHQWKHCLKEDRYKDIIVACLKTMVGNKQVELNAFCIMSNHIHLIWQPLGELTPSQVHASFTNYTGKQIKNTLAIHDPAMLEELKAKNYDREYQIWKRRSLSIELFTESTFTQKLEYIHANPVRAGLVNYREEYHYSSAAYYQNGVDDFNMLTHYSGN